MKKKGKLDPYAYIPLKKAQLNRRYRPYVQFNQELDWFKNVSSDFLIFVQKEKSQTAGPLQGHGERSPEGGAVWKENAEEEKKGLKNLRVAFQGLKMHVC